MCFYRYCKFVNLPSCVGIVPESWSKFERTLKYQKKEKKKKIESNQRGEKNCRVFTEKLNLLTPQVLLELTQKVDSKRVI